MKKKFKKFSKKIMFDDYVKGFIIQEFTEEDAYVFTARTDNGH